MLERLTGIKDKVINWISCGSFGLSLICLCIGLDKLFRYKNGDVYPYEYDFDQQDSCSYSESISFKD